MLNSSVSRLIVFIALIIFIFNVYYLSTIYSDADLSSTCGSLVKAPESSYGGGVKRQIERLVLSVKSDGHIKNFYVSSEIYARDEIRELKENQLVCIKAPQGSDETKTLPIWGLTVGKDAVLISYDDMKNSKYRDFFETLVGIVGLLLIAAFGERAWLGFKKIAKKII